MSTLSATMRFLTRTAMSHQPRAGISSGLSAVRPRCSCSMAKHRLYARDDSAGISNRPTKPFSQSRSALQFCKGIDDCESLVDHLAVLQVLGVENLAACQQR